MLYYSSARFFFLQLGKCVHICRPRVVPLCTAGVPTGWDGNGVAECSSGSLDPWWDALQRAQLMPEFRSGRVGSLIVKNMTIGIEASVTTTPENWQRLDGMRRSTPITAGVNLAVIDAL